MACVEMAQDVSRVFQHGVLKAATGAEKGSLPFPGVSNGTKRAVETGIRGCGHRPQPIEAPEIDAFVPGKLRCRQPRRLDGAAQHTAGNLERAWNGLMSRYPGVVVADEPYAEHQGHTTIRAIYLSGPYQGHIMSGESTERPGQARGAAAALQADLAAFIFVDGGTRALERGARRRIPFH